MTSVHSHYENLKVARDAPIEVIRAAYTKYWGQTRIMRPTNHSIGPSRMNCARSDEFYVGHPPFEALTVPQGVGSVSCQAWEAAVGFGGDVIVDDGAHEDGVIVVKCALLPHACARMVQVGCSSPFLHRKLSTKSLPVIYQPSPEGTTCVMCR